MYPITWKPSPNFSSRLGSSVIALVHHRMVGYLNGTDRWFANPDNQVSTHFGIGSRSAGGPVEISQYVDLSDAAWGNGNYDVSGGWPLIRRTASGALINPNRYTISMELQDGSTDNAGVVDPAFVQASIWLDRILLSGDPTLIRAAGIRMRDDSTAAGLKAIVVGPETIIDHNRIAGKLKPYCWRAWLDDPGFLFWKADYLNALTETRMTIEEVLALLNTKITELQTQKDAAVFARDAAIAERDAALLKLTTAKQKAEEITAL